MSSRKPMASLMRWSPPPPPPPPPLRREFEKVTELRFGLRYGYGSRDGYGVTLRYGCLYKTPGTVTRRGSSSRLSNPESIGGLVYELLMEQRGAQVVEIGLAAGPETRVACPLIPLFFDRAGLKTSSAGSWSGAAPR